MAKILYAANNSLSSKIQLSRFLEHFDSTGHELKIAAYKKSTPNINIDWCLDSLLSPYGNNFSLNKNNSILQHYFSQIKSYSPDLIISDLELYTNYVGNLLDLKVVQCSSKLLRFGVKFVPGTSGDIYRSIGYLHNFKQKTLIMNSITNSAKNYVYSHFGDLPNPLPLRENCEWIRPYHSIGNISEAAEHNIVSATINSNKEIIKYLSKYKDCVAFSEFTGEYFDKVLLKDLHNQEEYFLNLRNCKLFLTEGQGSFLSDAYYNGKYSIIIQNFKDDESMYCSTLSNFIGLSSLAYDISKLQGKEFTVNYNNIGYLHEKIDYLLSL